MWRRKWAFLGMALATLAMTAGCATQRVWMYTAEPAVQRTPVANKRVAVPPLSDARENVNHNLFGLGFIPLMPYGWQTLRTPEGIQMHMTSGLWLFKPPEDFAKAIAEDLSRSGLFKEAFFTYRAADGDWTLKGEIKSTTYRGNMYTYCLSGLGVYLWFLGVPSVSVTNELALSLQLIDNATGQVLWQGSYAKERGSISWGIYVMRPDFYYDKLLKEIMKEVIPSLEQKLAQPAK